MPQRDKEFYKEVLKLAKEEGGIEKIKAMEGVSSAPIDTPTGGESVRLFKCSNDHLAGIRNIVGDAPTKCVCGGQLTEISND